MPLSSVWKTESEFSFGFLKAERYIILKTVQAITGIINSSCDEVADSGNSVLKTKLKQTVLQ